jgi:hypothetical protein
MYIIDINSPTLCYSPGMGLSHEFLMHHQVSQSDQMELVCKGKVETLYLLLVHVQTLSMIKFN